MCHLFHQAARWIERGKAQTGPMRWDNNYLSSKDLLSSVGVVVLSEGEVVVSYAIANWRVFALSHVC